MIADRFLSRRLERGLDGGGNPLLARLRQVPEPLWLPVVLAAVTVVSLSSQGFGITNFSNNWVTFTWEFQPAFLLFAAFLGFMNGLLLGLRVKADFNAHLLCPVAMGFLAPIPMGFTFGWIALELLAYAPLIMVILLAGQGLGHGTWYLFRRHSDSRLGLVPTREGSRS